MKTSKIDLSAVPKKMDDENVSSYFAIKKKRGGSQKGQFPLGKKRTSRFHHAIKTVHEGTKKTGTKTTTWVCRATF